MTNSNTTIGLGDGEAVHLGDGSFMLLQRDDEGVVHSVYVTAAQIEALRDYKP